MTAVACKDASTLESSSAVSFWRSLSSVDPAARRKRVSGRKA
jgi:hypothetical protein